jgi:tryptophan 2,3-dioxygenase
MTDRMPGLYYAEYLDLDTLLSAQKPLSDHPDELHFIIIHQIHELWFKLALHHLGRARTALDFDELPEAVRLLNQVIHIIENSTQTARHLHSLPPASFAVFRDLLAPGSGLQSYQFRELEFLLGYRDPQHVEWVSRQLEKTGDWTRIAYRVEEPSIADALDGVLERRGVGDVVEIYRTPAAYPLLNMLADTLSRLDHRLLDWRLVHNQLVERTIGVSAVGTGGTTHDYLSSRLNVRLFPRLLAARDDLTRQVTHPDE